MPSIYRIEHPHFLKEYSSLYGHIFLKFLSGDNIGQQNELTHSVLYCNYIAISHYFMWVPLQETPPVPKIA